MMKSSTQITLIVLAAIVVALIACLPLTMLTLPLVRSNQEPTPDTFATIQAIVTQTVAAQTQTAPTQTPVVSTQIPATNTPVPPTSTPLPTATATAITYCDWVSFVKDVSISDGTVFGPGDTFTKTWRLKNRGTCTWTPDYMLVFASGDRLGGTTAVRLPGYVAPGQTVDVSVALTAPDSSGKYVGYWMLRNPSGALFGYGDKANQAFYVEIRVKVNELPHGTVTGEISYPSEFNPPMTLYFERVDNGAIIQFYIPENQMNYSVLLPNGNYYAYAWAPGYNLEGAYVNEYGILKTFTVQGGQTTSSIRITDWRPERHSRP
jgi:hypothetical protein